MTFWQKIIKYLAIALAIFLIINIIGAILSIIGVIGGVAFITDTIKTEIMQENDGLLEDEQNYSKTPQVITENIQIDNIAKLEIDVKYSNLQIKNGDTFKVESNDTNVKCTQKGNELTVKETGNNWLRNKEGNEVIIYIPENKEFNEIEIDTGAGNIEIESLNTKDLSFSIGAGKVEINNLKVTNEAEIDGGAGKVDILSGEICNLNLDMGIGEFNVCTKLLGNNDIEQGMGKLTIKLTDSQENYTIRTRKGMGSITIDGKEAQNNSIYGNGQNILNIEGGMGAIEITTNNELNQYI